ncbi:MAG TPA: hypothetical protein VGE70_06110 [Burkholderiaceae bacterium]
MSKTPKPEALPTTEAQPTEAAAPAAPAAPERQPMAMPKGGWPPDEFSGIGGEFIRDPYTGKRSRKPGTEPPPPTPGPAPEAAT